MFYVEHDAGAVSVTLATRLGLAPSDPEEMLTYVGSRTWRGYSNEEGPPQAGSEVQPTPTEYIILSVPVFVKYALSDTLAGHISPVTGNHENLYLVPAGFSIPLAPGGLCYLTEAPVSARTGLLSALPRADPVLTQQEMGARRAKRAKAVALLPLADSYTGWKMPGPACVLAATLDLLRELDLPREPEPSCQRARALLLQEDGGRDELMLIYTSLPFGRTVLVDLKADHMRLYLAHHPEDFPQGPEAKQTAATREAYMLHLISHELLAFALKPATAALLEALRLRPYVLRFGHNVYQASSTIREAKRTIYHVPERALLRMVALLRRRVPVAEEADAFALLLHLEEELSAGSEGVYSPGRPGGVAVCNPFRQLYDGADAAQAREAAAVATAMMEIAHAVHSESSAVIPGWRRGVLLYALDRLQQLSLSHREIMPRTSELFMSPEHAQYLGGYLGCMVDLLARRTVPYGKAALKPLPMPGRLLPEPGRGTGKRARAPGAPGAAPAPAKRRREAAVPPPSPTPSASSSSAGPTPPTSEDEEEAVAAMLAHTGAASSALAPAPQSDWQAVLASVGPLLEPGATGPPPREEPATSQLQEVASVAVECDLGTPPPPVPPPVPPPTSIEPLQLPPAGLAPVEPGPVPPPHPAAAAAGKAGPPGPTIVGELVDGEVMPGAAMEGDFWTFSCFMPMDSPSTDPEARAVFAGLLEKLGFSGAPTTLLCPKEGVAAALLFNADAFSCNTGAFLRAFYDVRAPPNEQMLPSEVYQVRQQRGPINVARECHFFFAHRDEEVLLKMQQQVNCERELLLLCSSITRLQRPVSV